MSAVGECPPDSLGLLRIAALTLGAGHDACNLNTIMPTAMVFIPSKDGISHNEIEDAQPEHITAGCNVLLHAMLERAGVAP